MHPRMYFLKVSDIFWHYVTTTGEIQVSPDCRVVTRAGALFEETSLNLSLHFLSGKENLR